MVLVYIPISEFGRKFSSVLFFVLSLFLTSVAVLLTFCGERSQAYSEDPARDHERFILTSMTVT